jgi:hypothetical protein
VKTAEDFPMAKGNRKETARSDAAERAFRLTAYYKIVTIYTLIVAIAYGALYYARTRGYQIINAPILYWLWFALVIGIILLVGKYVANLPKSESTRRGVRISVAIVSIATIFVSFMNVVSQMDSGLMKYATLTSPDGAHTAIVMKADARIAATATEQAKVYTIYAAYPRINRFFCDSSGELDVIMLLNDEDATINKEWTEKGLILTANSDAVQGDNTIEVTFN